MAGSDEKAGTDDGDNVGGGVASVWGRRAIELPRDEMTADNLLEKARSKDSKLDKTFCPSCDSLT